MDILAGLPPYAFTIIVGLFLLINLVIGLYQGRHLNSLRSYALADKSMGTGTLAITIIATIIGGQYVTSVVAVSSYGIFDKIACTMTPALMMILAAHYIFPRLLVAKDCYTLGDVLGRAYGKHAQIFTGIASALISIIFIAAQLRTVGVVAEALNLNKTIIIWSMAAIVILYTCLGGMRAVAATDVFQFLLLVIGLFWIVYRIFQIDNGTGQPIGSLQNLVDLVKKDHGTTHLSISDDSFFWMLLIGSTNMSWIMFSAPIVNRILVARNTPQMKNSIYSFSAFFVVLRFLITIVWLALIFKRGVHPMNSNIASKAIAEHLFNGSSWTILLLFVILLAVVLSTADSFLNSMSVVVLRDLITPLQGERRKEPEFRKIIVLTSIVGGILAALSALLLRKSLVHFFTAIGFDCLAMFVVPVILYAANLKFNKKIFWISIVSFLLLVPIIGWLLHKNYIYVDNPENWETFSFTRKRNILIPIVLVCNLVISVLAHIIMHGGLVFEPKPEEEERLGNVDIRYAKLRELFKDPFNWATEKVGRYGSAPVLIGMFLALSWMIPEMTNPHPVEENMVVLLWVRLIGVTLCTGLLLHNRWGHPYKRYFPLYYYVTLLYGLPFSATLYFLYNPNNYTTLLLLIVALVVLMILVDQQTFLLLLSIGAFLGWAVARMSPVHTSINADMLWHASVSIVYTILISFAFMKFKEGLIKSSLRRYKMWGLAYIHDMYEPVSALSLGPQLVDKVIKEKTKKTTQNGKVEYTLSTMSQNEYENFLVETIQQMKEAGEIANKLTKVFDDMNKSDYILKEDIEKDSMLAFAQKAMAFIPSGYKNQIEITLDTKNDFEVTLHDNFFSNVILNLLKNADRHGRATKIEMGCDPVRREFYFKDNGKGIPPHIEPYIFNLYFSTGSRGIGLPFVKQIIEMLKGSIRFETSQKGTTFFIHFPSADWR